MWVLILIGNVYFGPQTVTTVPHSFRHEADCHQAARNWDRESDFFTPPRKHICLQTREKN
jgi:hypothetical protein